jgi:predicted secreted protein
MIGLKMMLMRSEKDNRNFPPAFVNNCPNDFRIKNVFIWRQDAFSSDEKETAEGTVKSAPPIFLQLVAVNENGFLFTLPNNLFYQTITTKENKPHRRDHQIGILKTKCRRCRIKASAASLALAVASTVGCHEYGKAGDQINNVASYPLPR